MILKASRIRTATGAGAVAAHVLYGNANEEIIVLQGAESDLHDAMKDAADHGATYGIRHFKISPKEAMGREDARQIIRELAMEFGFDPSRAVIAEHKKPRAGEAGFDRHWHAMVPEVDPIAGRVLDCSWMRPRHEKIARLAEARLGHDLVPGRWNAAVARALDSEGHHPLAERVAAAAGQPRPQSAYTTTLHQVAARRGHDLPADKRSVAAAWKASDSPLAFTAALADQGVTIRLGDKPGVWLAERNGDLIGAVHRLTGMKLADVRDRLRAVNLAAISCSDTRANSTPVKRIQVGQPLPPPPVRPARQTPAVSPVGPQPVAGASAFDARTSARPGTTGNTPPHGAFGGGSQEAGPLWDGTEGGWHRYIEELRAYDERQNAKTGAAIKAAQGGDNRGQSDEFTHFASKAIRQWVNATREARSNPQETQATSNGRPAGAPRRDSRRPVRSASGDRHDGSEPRVGGMPSRSDESGQPHPFARPSEPSEAGRGIAPRTNFDTPGSYGRRHRSNGASRRRARGDDARDQHAFLRAAQARSDRFAALTARLDAPGIAARDPAVAARHQSRMDEARRMMIEDSRKTWGACRAAPWPDAASRNAEAIADALRDASIMERDLVVASLSPAQAKAAAAAAKVPPWHRLIPWQTRPEAEAKRLGATAEAAQIDACFAFTEHADKLKTILTEAKLIAGSRVRDQQSWEQSLAVRRARETERLNASALRLAQSGHPQVCAALADGDPTTTRGIVQQREEERKRREDAKRKAEPELAASGLTARPRS